MISILTDSCCDLSQELIDRYNVKVIPLHVSLGEKSYRDGVEITRDQLFDYVKQTGQLPKTSAISLAEAKEFFSGFEEMIFIGIGSQLSATMQSAILAKGELPKKQIYPVDSQNLSSGIGLLVLKAAEMAKAGVPTENIVMEIEQTVPKVRTAFVIDTLEYLYKGGRCSAVTNLIGSVLHIRPVIAVRDGTLGVKDKIGGSRKKALDSLLVDFKKNLPIIDLHRVFITSTGCDEDAEYLKKELQAIATIEEIDVTYAGATISSHCGPNTIGILYLTK